jgi:hypothetical protein
MIEKRRQRLAGALLGAARSGNPDKISAIARDLHETEGWSRRYSEKSLTEQLLPPLVEKLEGRLDIAFARELADKLVDGYEGYRTVQVIRLPVMNLTVPSPVEVGGAVLRTLDEELLAEMEAGLRLVVLEPPNSPGTADSASKRLREGWQDRMGQAVAELRVNAMRDVAEERGRERYAELLDFLNGATTLLYSSSRRMRVGAAGQFAREIENSFLISEPPESVSTTLTWRGPIGEFTLDEEAVSKLKECGYWQIAEVLALEPEDRTELESALITALHWYADHATQATTASQLLSLTISAETIFPRRGSGIGFGCAEAVAFAISDEAERRFAIRRAFQDLYGKRGDIAHRGEGEVTESDIYLLATLVIELLLKVGEVRSTYTTRAGLEASIDQARLA